MYSFESRIKYSEVGNDGFLRPDALVNYMQDCSGLQAYSLNIGTDKLNESGNGWIIMTWDIYVNRLPAENDKIKISTWPHYMRGCFGGRNFTIEDESGETLAYSDSLWVFMNKETGHPERVPEEIVKTYEFSDRLDMESKKRKIKTPEDLKEMPGVTVRKPDTDTNNHLNNANYIRFADEFIPEGKTVKNIQVEYRYATMRGECLIPYIKEEEDKLYVVLKTSDGEVKAVVLYTLA